MPGLGVGVGCLDDVGGTGMLQVTCLTQQLSYPAFFWNSRMSATMSLS